jgi:hypothetical protein
MTRTYVLYFFLASLSWLVGCQSTPYEPETYQGKQLLFGAGGGITGAVTTYSLLPNGDLYRDAPHDSTGFALLAEGKRAAAKAAHKQARSLAGYELDAPGNFYYFLALRSKKTTYRLTWGQADLSPPPEVQALYDYLMAMVRAQTAPER